MTTEEMITYDQIVEMGIATAEEINLVRNCTSGTWTEILNGIIHARTGFQSIQQMIDAEEDILYSELRKIRRRAENEE